MGTVVSEKFCSLLLMNGESRTIAPVENLSSDGTRIKLGNVQ